MNKKMQSIYGLILGLAMVSSVVAQTAATTAPADPKDAKKMTTPSEIAPTPAESTPKSLISGDFGISVYNQYYSRGYIQPNGNKGVQAQPYADLYFDAYEGDGFLTSIKPTIGLWSNLQSYAPSEGPGVPTNLNKGLRYWEEFDWMPGVAFTFAKKWTLTETYLEFDSPANQYKPTRSLNSNLAFDDTGLIDKSGNFSIQPHFTFLAGLQTPAEGGYFGNYYEIGISPNYTILKKCDYPVTIALPITIGLGDDRFYGKDQVYGYSSYELVLSTPLAFIPAGYGSWTGKVSVEYLNQGTDVAYANVGNGTTSPNQIVFGFSIGTTF